MDIETRRARREQRRAATRRRRRLGALLVLVLAICAVVATAAALHPGGSSSSKARDGKRHRAPLTAPRTGTLRTSSAATASGQRARPAGNQPVPILMYHVIAEPPPGAPFPGLYVNPAEFAEQMHALQRAGWHAVTLDEVAASWQHGAPLGTGKPIVISFDNGYQSQYTQALPILRRLGWVGDENIQLSGLPPSQGGFGAGQIRGLLAAGWELDTQGFSHADLITLDAQQLHYQVAIARETLRRRFHVAVNWFCYPSGHYDPTVVAAVKAAGYSGSTTVIPGWAHPGDDRYRLHRLRVLGGTTGTQLLALVDDTRSAPAAPDSYSGG